MRDRVCIYFLYMIGNMQCLYESLCTYTQRISIVFQNIPKNQVLYNSIIIAFLCFNCLMRLYTEGVSMILNMLQFILIKSAGIYDYAVYLVSFFFSKIFYTERGVQSTAKAENNFF